MQPFDHSWPAPTEPGGDLARLEAKVDDLLTALETSPAPVYSEQPPAGLMSYWRALKQRAAFIIVPAVVLAAAGWFIGKHEQKVYQARGTIELLEPGRTLNVRNLSSSGPMFGGDTYIETQVTKLRSVSMMKAVWQKVAQDGSDPLASARARSVTAPALDQPTEGQIQAMRNNLTVFPIRGTSLVAITYDSPDPKVSAEVVNALTTQYIASEMDARAGSAVQTRDWLEKELDGAKVKLESSESKLQQYANASGLLYTSPKGNAGEQSEDKLQFIAQELSEAQAKRATVQARYQVALAKPSDAPVSADESETLHSIQGRLIDLRRQRASLASQFTPAYYKVQQVDAEIAELQNALSKEYLRWLGQLREEYQTEQEHEKLVEQAYHQQAALVSDQAAKAIHYNVLKREVETNRDLYDSLLAGMKEAGVNAAARVRDARVVDPATPPQFPYRPNLVRNAGIGLLSGLMLGIAFVLVSETNDRRVKSPGTAPSYLNVPELGVIPSVKPHLLPTARRDQVDGHRPSTHHNLSPFATNPAKAAPVANAFHSAVTSIFLSGRYAEPPKVVVVTSGMAHEGKSTVVGNLGLMAAQTGKRVLLIDGDLRNPRLHQTYAASNDQGLTNLLLEDAPLDANTVAGMLHSTNVDRLWLLSGGPDSAHLLSLLHSERLPELVAHLRQDFDLILIDTPPVLQFADARLFGKLADAVILVVRSGYTTRNMAMAAKARFMDDGLPIIGTILNDWNGKEAGYEYSEARYRS
jgi:succinoglycan biosynthesis transport protein ExoP